MPQKERKVILKVNLNIQNKLAGFLSLFFVCFLFLNCIHSSVSANPVGISGVGLTPAIINLTPAKNQQSISSSIRVSNLTSQVITLKPGVQDFKALNDLGNLSYFSPNYNLPHDLGSRMTFDQNNLTIPANSSVIFNFNIVNLSSLAAGGHYGILDFKLVPNKNSSANLAINQVIGTLVFLDTYSGGTFYLNLVTPVLPYINYSWPSRINAIFINSGNSLDTPSGILGITYSKDQQLYKSLININGSYILPASSRLFSFNLPNHKTPFWPTEYKLSIKYRHQYQTKFSNYTTNFWIINPLFIILVILLIIVLILFSVTISKKFKKRYINNKG